MLLQNEKMYNILKKYNEYYIYDLNIDYSDLTNFKYYNIILNDLISNYYMKKIIIIYKK